MRCDHICHEHVIRTVMHINDGVVSWYTKRPPGAFLAFIPKLKREKFTFRHKTFSQKRSKLSVRAECSRVLILWVVTKAYTYACFKFENRFIFRFIFNANPVETNYLSKHASHWECRTLTEPCLARSHATSFARRSRERLAFLSLLAQPCKIS